MTTILILFAVTAVVFLALDAVMLTFVMKPLFTTYIGDMMAENFRFAPAAVFYLFYVAGILYLVSWPALRDNGPVFLPAAVLGAMAYGTYEFTSYAIMKNWSPAMVTADVIWGTILTATAATAGVAVARYFG